LAGLSVSSAAEQVLQVASWVKYPGSSTSAVIAGALYITPLTVDGNVTHKLTWKLTGTDDLCNGTESGNVCGIHMHVGKDCADAATIGGHLYSTDIDDPWAQVRYSSDAAASTQVVSQDVETGLTTDDLLKRVVIVYNSVGSGERIACGIATAVPAIPKTEINGTVANNNGTTSLRKSAQVSLAYGITHISGLACMLVALLLQF